MSETPQWTYFNAEEPQLYSKLLPNDGAHHISKAEPSKPIQKVHFSYFYLVSRSCGHDPYLVPTG